MIPTEHKIVCLEPICVQKVLQKAAYSLAFKGFFFFQSLQSLPCLHANSLDVNRWMYSEGKQLSAKICERAPKLEHWKLGDREKEKQGCSSLVCSIQFVFVCYHLAVKVKQNKCIKMTM